MITQDIAQHLKQGKTIEDLLALGYKKGTIYAVQRKLREQGSLPIADKANGQHPSSPREGFQAEDFPEVEDDPEILQLKKDIRKAQLERQLRELKAPFDLEPKVNALWTALVTVGLEKRRDCGFDNGALCGAQCWKTKEQVPLGIGALVSKGHYWYVKPNTLHCALCTAHLYDLLATR